MAIRVTISETDRHRAYHIPLPNRPPYTLLFDKSLDLQATIQYRVGASASKDFTTLAALSLLLLWVIDRKANGQSIYQAN